MGAVTGARGARGAAGAAGAPGPAGPAGASVAVLPFGMADVAAGDHALASEATPVAAQWGGAPGLTVGWVAPRGGSLTALSAALSAAAAGSDAIVGVYKNGTLLGPATVVTLASATNDTAARGTFTAGAYTFVAGDVLDVRVRTAIGWSAPTADLGVAVEVTF